MNIVAGPGIRLHVMLSELGFGGKDGCGCESMIVQMNQWGSECRQHKEEIIAHLEKNRNSVQLISLLRAGIKAVNSGLPLTIEGLIDLAIEQYEKARDFVPRGCDNCGS